MKIVGVDLEAPREEILVLPRGKQDVVIKAVPVLSYDDFDNLCPVPMAPIVLLPGNIQQRNIEDPEFKKANDTWSRQRIDWMILKSLEPSQISWDTIKMDDPTTWGNFFDEFKKAQFSEREINLVIELVFRACGLDQKKIEAATESFLAGAGKALSAQFSPTGENSNTQSGEPAKESESVPQK